MNSTIALPTPATSDDAGITTIAAIAQQAALPQRLDEGIYAVLCDGDTEIVETIGYTQQREEARGLSPLRVKRHVEVHDVQSLLDYLRANTHPASDGGLSESYGLGEGLLEVWAEVKDWSIIAILDGIHGWREHTCTLELRQSPEWCEWRAVDGKLFDQVKFAQFIEDHLSSIGAPDGAHLLEICQTLEARTKVDFKSSVLLANGQRQFRFEETLDAKAGQKGDLTIPAELTLVLRPFIGSDPIAVTARFRYELRDGVLSLGVRLADPERLLEETFDAVVDELRGEVPVPVLHGAP